MARRLIPVLAAFAFVVSAMPAAGAGTVTVNTSTTTTVEGEVVRLAVELYDGGGVDLTLVVPEDGDAVRVLTQDLAEVPTGSVVSVEVAEIPESDVLDADGGAEVVDVEILEAPDDAGQAVGLAEAPLAALISGVRSVEVVTGRIGSQGADSMTTATLASDITNSVAPYWSDSTGGALSFAAGGQTAAGSYGDWGPTTCTEIQILGILAWSAEQAGISEPGSQQHSVLYTPQYATCGFAGVGHVADGGSAWINGNTNPPMRWVMIAHELGHTVTLGHSNSRVDCPGADGTSSQCYNGEYGDAYDVMGTSVAGAGPLSGANLDVLGLLPAGSVTATSPQTVTLAPVGGLSGTRFLKFATSLVTYYVEYRGATGRDADLATNRRGCPYGPFYCPTQVRYMPGVVIRRVDSAALGADSYLLDAAVEDPDFDPDTTPWFVLPEGMTFTTADGIVSITVADVSGAGAEVVVTMPDTPHAQVVLSRDFTGDGRADVFAVDSTGQMYLFPGLGNGRLNRMRTLGAGWQDLRVFAPGDWNGDHRADLVAADAAGDLWLYAGTGSGGLRSRVQIGHGWASYRIIPAGDVNGDGPMDLLAIDATGVLFLYPGRGNGLFRPRIQVGHGWTTFELYAAGDMNRDGRVDILGVRNDGVLFYYAGKGSGFFRPAVQVGHGWTGYVFASGADLNGDGLSDLLGRDLSGGLWYYAGRTGGKFQPKVQIGANW